MWLYQLKQFQNSCQWCAALALLLLVPSFAGTADSLLILPKNWLEQIYQPQPQISVSETAMSPKKYAPRLKKDDSQQLIVNSQQKIENKYIKELTSKFPVLAEKLNRLNFGFKEINNRYIPNEYYDTITLKRTNAFASFPTKWGDEIDFAGKVSLKPIVSRSVILPPEGLNREEESRLIHPLTTGDSSALPQNDNAKHNNAVLIYEDAFPNTDVIYAAGPNEIEEFYYVKEHSNHASLRPRRSEYGGSNLKGADTRDIATPPLEARNDTSFNYELKLKDNLKEARVLESGELAFYDKSGKVILKVSAPIVYDTMGKIRKGRFELTTSFLPLPVGQGEGKKAEVNYLPRGRWMGMFVPPILVNDHATEHQSKDKQTGKNYIELIHYYSPLSLLTAKANTIVKIIKPNITKPARNFSNETTGPKTKMATISLLMSKRAFAMFSRCRLVNFIPLKLVYTLSLGYVNPAY